jgi:hypothetical protein
MNELFAEKVSKVYKPGDIVMVHDYYLMLLPEMLRQRHVNIHILFFLESPFPTSELVRCLQLIAIWVGAGVARLALPHAFGLLPFLMLVSLPRPSSVDDFAHCPGHFTILEALAICVSCKPGILYPNSFMLQQQQGQQHG